MHLRQEIKENVVYSLITAGQRFHAPACVSAAEQPAMDSITSKSSQNGN